MPQEDYFKRQIDQFAKAMAKLLHKLSGTADMGLSLTQLEMVNNILQSESGLTIEKILGMNVNNFVNELVKQCNLSDTDLESLAEVLYLSSINSAHRNELLVRVQTILEHLNSESKTYSFERQFKLEQIKRTLSNGDLT